jgi:hypothetical protein
MSRHTASPRSRGRCGTKSGAMLVAFTGLAVGWAQAASASAVGVDLAYLDTTIKMRHPTRNYVDATDLEIAGGPQNLVSASLFFPDLAPLAGHLVLRATLMISKVGTLAETCCESSVHRIDVAAVASPWSPSRVSWRSRPKLEPATVSRMVSTEDAIGTQYSFDITAIVRAWVSGDLPSLGLALAVDEFFATPGNIYAASQGAPLVRPKISVSMTPTPEPGTLVLVGMGLIIITRVREHERQIDAMLAA